MPMHCSYAVPWPLIFPRLKANRNRTIIADWNSDQNL
jgi:hypothetical protein